ncbi:MAG TPA: T9SS type A sorting domain-containing protein [Chitinophagales bacterium]|nr:T9SS type A sorting domain-containing protein [Chitinophagales bacterium]
MTSFRLLLAFTVINFLFLNAARSQCAGFAHTGGPNNDNAWGITLDDAANSYSAGYYYGPSLFGNYTANDTGLFLIKYDSIGTFQWVKTFEGTFGGVFSFLNYSHGAIFLNVTFSGTVTFDNYILTGNAIGNSIAIIKFDLDGNVQWARTFSCTNISYGYGIWNTAAGDPLITGRYRGTLTMGGTTLTGPSSGYGIYLAKLDADNGSVIWATSSAAQNTYLSRGYVIRTDGSGNILLSGYYAYILSFGNQTLDNSAYTSSAPPFVAKFDSNGTALWIRGGTGDIAFFTNAYGLETDSLNNIYFSSPLSSSGNFSGTTVHPDDGTFIIGKYDASGNLLWLKQFGTHDSLITCLSFSLHINNNQTLTAYGWGLDKLYFGTDTLTCAGGEDLFSVDLDQDGSYLSSFLTGGIYNEGSYDAAYDHQDHAYVAGAFYGDSTTLGDFKLTGDSGTYGNYFVWKNCAAPIGNGVSPVSAINVSVSPNPSHGLFFVKGISDPNTMIEVYDLEGRNIWNGKANAEAFIDLGAAPGGVYAVKIISGNAITLKKIVIE